ncbi:MAG: hypothetical protein RIG68_11810 [Imperialibacter sp.]|uniref:hypothetical protein n=1 Tax=Imperialibacter sp. TaxID=2038411 RepID=UPI0032F03919
MKSLLIVSIILAGCIVSTSEPTLYPYLSDPDISNKLGEPVTDSAYFFPIEHFIDSIKFSNTIEIRLDTFSVEWYSEQLRFMSEPILYNFYLGKQVYRLTWLRSLHPGIVLRLENLNGEIILTQKELTLIKPWKRVDSVTYTYAPERFKLKDKSKKLKSEFWRDFERLLADNNFDNMPTTVAWEVGTDGSEWILERHDKDGYFVVNRWTPNERQYKNFREIGDYLIDASIFKKDERY